MCDSTGVALEMLLEHKRDKILHPIYYASKALNEAQKNYTVIEQDLLAMVYVFETFRLLFARHESHSVC